ncbi:MAG: ATP-binding cassette domain-containing protein, partial [Betaproteobacteria bacterium]|nr:ATP-binding cassette domain-containing protein [Betaproteobacteria bacterium]
MNAPVLALEGFSRRFGGLVALDQLDMQVGEGEIVGLIGPNGSGKTTCFNVLTGIYEASAGRARFLGRDITNLRAQAVYEAGIARTFQRSRLCLPLSIVDNILLGNHKNLSRALWFNLFRRAAFARQFEQAFEEARELVRVFDAPLAERLFEAVGTLPMIDRRRIEICRALVSR